MAVAGMLRDAERLDEWTRRVFGARDAEGVLRAMTSDEAIRYLRSFDCEAVRVQSLRQLKKEYTATQTVLRQTYQFLEQCQHPIGRLVIVPPSAIRFDGYAYPTALSPKYGADTMAILARYKKTHLLVTGDASAAYSRNYMPFTDAASAMC